MQGVAVADGQVPFIGLSTKLLVLIYFFNVLKCLLEVIILVNSKDYSFSYKGTKCTINYTWVEKLKSINTEINEDYLDYLLLHRNPHEKGIASQSFLSLIEMDYCNKKMFNSKKFGTIYQYNKDGMLISKHCSIENILKIQEPKKFLYSFYKPNNFFVPTRKGIDFFNTKLTTSYDQKSWMFSDISRLNYIIKESENYGGLTRCSKLYNDDEYKFIKERFTLEEFCEARKKHFLFCLGLGIHCSLKQKEQQRKRILEISSEEYENKREILFKRYSYNGHTLFKKVENLKNYSSYKGIYLLCLPTVKGYYIGKTNSCFRERITGHFRNSRSDFDKLYGPRDIQEIYVLPFENININIIEQDCIATIGKELALNSLVGGDDLCFLDEDYKETNYLISNNKYFENIKEKIYNSSMQAD